MTEVCAQRRRCARLRWRVEVSFVVRMDADTRPSTAIRPKQRMIVAHHGVVGAPADAPIGGCLSAEHHRVRLLQRCKIVNSLYQAFVGNAGNPAGCLS